MGNVGKNPSKLAPVLIGGVFIGVTSALPILNYLNCACCILVIGGGVLAAYLYLRDYPAQLPRMTYGEGAWLGLQTGLVGGFVWSLVAIPLSYIKLRLGLEIAELAQLEEALSDPEIPPMVREVVQRLLEQGVLTAGVLVVSVILYLVVSCLFATLGGILGVAIFQKKATPPAAMPIQDPAPTTPAPPSPEESQEGS